MRKDFFKVIDTMIDYSILGRYPESLYKLNKEKMIEKFMEVFQYTFTNTAMAFYGPIEDIKELIEDSLVFDNCDFDNYSKCKQWDTIVLIAVQMFINMHDAPLGMEVAENIVEHLDDLSEDELHSIVIDLNASLYFIIEECMTVTPSYMKLFNATTDDVFMLDDFLNNKEQFEKLLGQKEIFQNVDKEKFEECFKRPFNIKTAKKILLDGFLLQWTDMSEFPAYMEENRIPTQDDVDEASAEIFSVILIYATIIAKTEDAALEITENMYNYIIKIYETNYLNLE